MSRGSGSGAAAAQGLERGGSCVPNVARAADVLLGPAGASRQSIQVLQCLVEFCLKQDWLERSGEDLILSEAGRAMLRRAEAGDDAYRQQHQLRGGAAEGGRRHPASSSRSRSPVLRDITVSMWLTRHAGVERAFAIGEARTTGRRSIRGRAPAISEPWERSRWPSAHPSGSSPPWRGGRSSAAASGALSDAGG